MMTIIDEENWKNIAEMIGVEIGVPFKVKIPPHLKEYMKRAMHDYDDDVENLEYCIYADGFACHDTCRNSVFFGHDNDFIYNFILGGVLNGDMQVLRLKFRPVKGIRYYYTDYSTGDIHDKVSEESHFDIMNFCTGNCFKSYNKALANRDVHFGTAQKGFNDLYE